jgi:TATA-binding protein-associated factor Taf7
MDNINLDKLIKPDELDYNMILSVPEDIGQRLQRIIQGTATQEEKSSTNLQIVECNDNMDNPTRKLIFKVNDMMLPMTIVDLPCIIEAKKTIDYKTFYKSSDISQMMFVHDKEFRLSSEAELENFNPFKRDHIFNKITWKKDPDHPFKLKHGISKSTRNVRARRFKRKNRYNEEEMFEVCKKLKSIIDVI